MAQSGITANAGVKQQFSDFADSKNAFLHVTINSDTFEVASILPPASSHQATWEALKSKLPPKDPAYFIYRIPPTGDQQQETKFVVVFYVPDVSKVKDRMIYSSSMDSLKRNFGSAKFSSPDTYRISLASEADWTAFNHSRQSVDLREVMTFEEINKKDAEADSVGSMGSGKVGAIVGADSKLKDGATDALKAFHSGKVGALILQLDAETEVLEEVEKGEFSFEDIAKKLDKKEPRYVLVRFKHDKDGEAASAVVFLYYCPDAAKPKLKMFYSSAKAMMNQLLAAQGIEIAKKLEASEPGEVTSQLALDELYPKSQAKAGFKKPKSAASKGGRGMIGGIKFNSTSPTGPNSPTSPGSG